MNTRPSTTIATLPKLGDFTITPSEVSSQTHQAHNDLDQTSACLHFIDEKELPEQKAKYDRIASCGNHPSRLRLLGETHSRLKSAIVLQDFDENVISFISRRLATGEYLTAMELVSVSRQMIAALFELEAKGIPHGGIYLKNMVVSRNGQKQSVFRVGYLDTKKTIPVNASHKSDIFNTAVAICQTMLLDNNDIVRGEDLDAKEQEFRAKMKLLHAEGLSLAKKKALTLEVKKLSKQVTKLRKKVKALHAILQKKNVHENYRGLPDVFFQTLLEMLDGNPEKRPALEVVRLVFHSIVMDIIPIVHSENLPEQKLTPFAEKIESSVKDEPILAAGFGENIIKAAQINDAEAQYQLALLMSERGNHVPAHSWVIKAAVQGHANAQWFAACDLLKGRGVIKNSSIAEEYFRKAAAQNHTDAQVALANLILAKRELKASELQDAISLLNKAAETNADAKDALVLLASADLCGSEIETKEQTAELNDIYFRAAKKIDHQLSHRDGQSVLLSTLACLEDKPRVIHPFELKSLDKAIPSQRILRTKTVEEVVEVKKISEASMKDQLQKYLLLCHLPKHPHVQRVDFCGYFESEDITTPNAIATVVPMMQQGSLNDFFADKENRYKSVSLILPWAVQMASALEALHSRNLIHKDISLNNIFVSNQNGIPQTVLGGCIDHVRFGLDRPEEKEYPKADNIAAFGWTLLEMLIQTDPLLRDVVKFNRAMETEELTQLFELIVQPPVSAPKEFCNLIKRCIDQYMVQRPTASELVDSLSLLTKIEPIRIRDNTPVFIDDVYKLATAMLADNPKFASALLCFAADAGNTLAQLKLAELLFDGDVIPENGEEAIRYCTLAVKSKPENQSRLYWMLTESEKRKQRKYQQELKQQQEQEQKQKEEKERKIYNESLVTPAESKESLNMAFQHFFGLNVERNLKRAHTFLVRAAACKKSDNAELARAILSSLRSSDELEEKSPLLFYAPGNDFLAPFVQVDPTVYRRQGRTFQCSIVGRAAVLSELTDPNVVKAELNRCAFANPNVIGPVGITSDVTVTTSTGAVNRLPFALLYAPVQAAPADRSMVSDPITVRSRLLPFLFGGAKGLTHLHRNHVLHGNVSLSFLSVRANREGLVATGPAFCRRASAPESLAANQFSTASDVFDFGKMIAYMLTGDWDNSWLSMTEADPKAQLARLTASAASGYADIRARIPQWCPAQLVEIMVRCLDMDSTKRPTMDTVTTDIQNLRRSFVDSLDKGERTAQIKLHTNHIFSELTVDDTLLQECGTIECLYGPRIRERLQQNYDPNTRLCKIIEGKQTPGAIQDKSKTPSSVQTDFNLMSPERKIIEHKAQFFTPPVSSVFDDVNLSGIGIRHRPGTIYGPQLLDDKRLAAFIDRIDKPPYRKCECNGEPGICRCHRGALPKQPKIVNGMPTDWIKLYLPFLEFNDFGAFSGTCKIANKTCEGYTVYWEKMIYKHGNQGLNWVPLEALKKDGYSTAMTRRWAKIIMTQTYYAKAYKILQKKTCDIVNTPDMTREERKQLIDKDYADYEAKTCACGICRKPTPFADFFADARSKAIGGPFMADSKCVAHRVWTMPEARTVLGFTQEQLDQIPFWKFSTSRRLCTPDLFEFRIRMPMIVNEETEAMEASDDTWERCKDFPGYDKVFVRVEQEQKEASAADAAPIPKKYFVLFKPLGNLPESKEPRSALTRSEADALAPPRLTRAKSSPI